MSLLDFLLAGREGRAWLQRHLISRFGLVLQVSLNIPGIPKRLDGDRDLVEMTGRLIRGNLESAGAVVPCVVTLDNGAGCALLMGLVGADGREVKMIAMKVEARSWGSVIDIDVIGPEGTLHGESLGRDPRRCLLCESAAKECAREKRHDINTLREAASRLVNEGIRDLSGSV
ncbi:MAG TPA: citrate lyase holo-[acyl-carrier protein] synthase [Synergistales bacterium]|nr:citrate lyase holo-[acyl-carrier protein] synthase [Synergistales bacterium]